jgi:hypothetical protein
MKKILSNHLDDCMIALGAGLAVFVTSQLSLIAAGYVASAFLIGIGVLIGIGRGRKA